MTLTIALPALDDRGLSSRICRHFGHCPHFALVDIIDAQLSAVRSVDNPYVEQHRPGQIPEFVKSLGARVILAGGMGKRAIDAFAHLGISVAQAETDTVGSSVRAYIAGIVSDVEVCTEHAFEQDCSNH